MPFNDYIKNKFSNSNDYNLQSQYAPQQGNPTELKSPNPNEDTSSFDKEGAAKGFARGAQGGLGSGVLGAGIASGSAPVAGAGVGLMALEANAQADQADQEAKAIEAQQRKNAQMTAINNLISVSKGLNLGV